MTRIGRTDMAAIILARHIGQPLLEAIVMDGWKRVKLVRFRVRRWGRQSGLLLPMPVSVSVAQISQYWDLCKHLHEADKSRVADWSEWYRDGLFLVDEIAEQYKAHLDEDELNFLRVSLEAQIANPPAEYASELAIGPMFALKDVYGDGQQ